MRVALLSRSAHPLHEPGGLERAVYCLAHQLGAKGAETVLVTRPPTRTGSFPGEVETVAYRSWPGLSHGRVLDRALGYPRFAAEAGRAVARRVRGGTVDVVDAQGLMAWGYARLRRQNPSLAAPLIMNPQGMEEHKTRGLKRLVLCQVRALSRAGARLADRVVATDEATREQVPQLLGVDPRRVVVMPNGVDLEEIARVTPDDPEAVVREAFGPLADARPLLLSVGRIEGYKGFDDIRQALLRLRGRPDWPEEWAWIAVGEGPQRSRLKRGSRSLGARVAFPGHVSETVLHALYARATALVHATHDEGSSLVTLEAMAHGLPVLATRTGGIPDKVVDGQSGRLVKPGDIEGLCRGLLEAASSPESWRAMGQRGRERVAERFSWAVLGERVIALYQELVQEGR